jgi:periplasmic protein TonB
MRRKLAIILGVVGALVVHAVLLLFGGIIFLGGEETHASKRDIELVSEDVQKDKQEQQPEERKELKQEEEKPPEAGQQIKSTDAPIAGEEAPALDAASLGALEAALNGGGAAGGDFGGGGGASLASGGRIGGTGKPGSGEGDGVDSAFSMSEIDQRPRPVQQVAGAFPSELRGKVTEGVVTLIFVVDETGRVVNPRVEKSSHPEFEKPALDAVRQWKFEPAVKGGKRVSCKMRVPFRFQSR